MAKARVDISALFNVLNVLLQSRQFSLAAISWGRLARRASSWWCKHHHHSELLFCISSQYSAPAIVSIFSQPVATVLSLIANIYYQPRGESRVDAGYFTLSGVFALQVGGFLGILSFILPILFTQCAGDGKLKISLLAVQTESYDVGCILDV